MITSRSEHMDSAIIDDLFHISSIAAEAPMFDHLRLFGTCKTTPEGQTVIAGEWRPETETGQPLLLENSPVRFFKYTDAECEWFFNWMQDQLLNPDTHLSALLLPKCVLVMEPSDDFPFRAELSLSGVGIDELTNVFLGGSSFLSMGSLGRQFVLYVKPHLSPFGKIKPAGFTGNGPRAPEGVKQTGMPPAFATDSSTHPFPMSPNMFGMGMPFPSELFKHTSMPPMFKNKDSTNNNTHPWLKNATDSWLKNATDDMKKTVASLTDSGDNDIFAAVNEHVNQPNMVVTENSPNPVVEGIAEDMTMRDLVASRAKMNIAGAELQRQIHELGNEYFQSNPVEVEESVAPSDVSTEPNITTAEALGEQAAVVNELVGQVYSETVKDAAAVESMFPDSTAQDIK